MRHLSFILGRTPLLLGMLFGALLWSGCRNAPESDAHGNFRATEVTVSAEAPGRLVRLSVDEGDRLRQDEVVGLVDTTRLAIHRRAIRAQRQSLVAQRRATLAQEPEIRAQVGALHAQLETAEEELARTQRLFEDQAATAQALSRQEGEVNTLHRQIEQVQARSDAVREQAVSIAAQINQIESQVEEIEQQMEDARVVNPEPGTVLTVVARRGETVQVGTPLYTVADLDTLTLRAYAAGDQLPRLRLGMSVEVLVDDAEGGLRPLQGRVVRIADEAQFTPTPIQTRDERAALVYAFDVRVPNPDGLLKIGMPGEVRFADGEEERMTGRADES